MSLLDFLKRGPRKKLCARCGHGAAHGYSRHAESDAKEITFLCLSCLAEQLQSDYAAFRGRAVVVEPAAGLPCYVFRDRQYLNSLSPTLDRDINALLSRIELCSDCKAPANCLWIGSKGISIETFGEVLKRGPSQTLLTWGNSETASQCGKCLSARISKDLRSGNYEFFEICSPHDTEEGLVMPMAY